MEGDETRNVDVCIFSHYTVEFADGPLARQSVLIVLVFLDTCSAAVQNILEWIIVRLTRNIMTTTPIITIFTRRQYSLRFDFFILEI